MECIYPLPRPSNVPDHCARFLLAHLHVGSLAWKHTVKAVRESLKKLPKELDEAYNEALERIWDQEEGDVALAKDVLGWIAYAKRPLRVQELRSALAAGDTSSELDNGSVPHEDFLVSVCAGIVTIDRNSNIIRLVHYTTQDYMLRFRRLRFPSANVDIAKSCLNYLSLVNFQNTLRRSGSVLGGNRREPHAVVWSSATEHLLKTTPLISYTSKYGFIHVQEVEQNLQEDILYFLESGLRRRLVTNMQFYTEARGLTFVWEDPPAICVAAKFGLLSTVGILLERGADIDEADECGATALHYAAEGGHDRCVQYLLNNGASRHARTRDGQSAKDWAFLSGQSNLERLLTEFK